MAADVSTLERIFHMIEPADLLGAQKLAVANKSIDENVLRELLDLLFNMGRHGGGFYALSDLQVQLDTMTRKAQGATLKQFQQLIHFYSSEGKSEQLSKSQNIAQGDDGATLNEDVTFEQIIGKGAVIKPKKMGIITCNSGFISPVTRNTGRVELFLNFLPSLVASRMVPLLDVEFEFNRGTPTTKESTPRTWAPGLLRFLLGGDSELVKDEKSPTAKMMALRESQSSDGKKITQMAGMELFTSPQMLVNPSPAANAGRYVDVLDPFRPLMSIENFSVNVSPTVGLYSYKKATLTLKLHDRSRMGEIADLVRPQVYADALSAPTVWITYGWRHPAEPGNPYAEFINRHMLVREAYGVINSQFAFDRVGQAIITLNLWTKGVSELRTANINTDGTIQVIEDLKNLAKSINTHLAAKGINLAEGANKEIRSALVLESAQAGTYPDMKKEEIQAAIKALKDSLSAPSAKIDAAAVATLKGELDKLDKSYLAFKDQVATKTSEITASQFAEAITGADPFIPFTAKAAKQKTETGKAESSLAKVVDAYNKAAGSAPIKDFKSIIDKQKPGVFKKKLASLGKVVSVFTANVIKNTSACDELQLFFYQFNDKAGLAASTNIAEFPIEMNVFLDQYREHIERKGSERVTLEEFLQLLFDAQVNDPRALGYGFREFYAPYDPANKHNVELAKGKKPEDLLMAQADFVMPAPAVYVETAFATVPPEGSSGTTSVDLLQQYELQKPQAGGPNVAAANRYVRIMRVHIFDKANNPYKLPAKLLTGDDDTSFQLKVDEAKKAETVKQASSDIAKAAAAWQAILTQLNPDGTLDANKDSKVSNDEIKRFVSKMVPTIVYGGNASTIVNANLASKQDPLLATTQMQAMSKKAGKMSNISSNGADVGGLPLRIVPASMTMTTLGCPLLTYAQMFFIDFNTGTTIDNIYGLTGITHNITPGKFESQLTLTFADAYGRFFGTHQRVFDYFKALPDQG